MPSTTRLVRGVDEAVTGRSAAPSAVRESVAASADQATRELEEQLFLEMRYAQDIKNKQAEKAAEAAPEPSTPSLTPLEDGVYRDDSGATFLVEGGKIKPTDMSQAEGKPDTSQASSVEPVYDRDESGNIFFLEGDKKISSKDKIFYHSTTADFENFEIKDSTAFDYGDGESSGGIFFSPDPSGGEYVLDNGRGRFLEGSNTRPVKLDLGDRPVILKDLYPDLMVKSLEYQAKILKTLARDGATSAIFPNGEVVVFSPEQITSAIR